MPWSGLEAWAWAAVLLAALGSRLISLDRDDPWLDESCTSFIVRNLGSWPEDGPPSSEVAHLPYFALLRVWSAAAGGSIPSLRCFSVVAGWAGVLAVGLLGRGAGGRAGGIVALVLAAANPLHIHYSREARVYALWILAMAACVLVLRRAALLQRRRDWVAFAVMAWLAVVVHYYTILWLPATVAAVLIARDRGRFLRRWLTVLGLLGLALVPVVVGLVIPNAGTGPRRWLRDTWEELSSLPIVLRSFLALLPAGWYPDYLGAVGAAHDWLAASWGTAAATTLAVTPGILFAAVLAFLAAGAWKSTVMIPVTDVSEPSGSGCFSSFRMDPWGTDSGSRQQDRRWANETWWLLAMSWGFLATAWLGSACWRPMYVVGRYDLAVWPAVTAALASAIVGLGRGSATLIRRWTGPIAVTLVLLLCSLAVQRAAWAIEPSRDTSERVRRLAAAVGDNDLIVSVGMYRWFLDSAWRERGKRVEWRSFPPSHDRQLCWEDAERELALPGEIEAGVKEVLHRVDQALWEGRGVWLLAQGEPGTSRWEVDRRLFEALAEGGIELDLREEWLGLAALHRAR